MRLYAITHICMLLLAVGCAADDEPDARVNTEDVSPRLERPDKAGRSGTLRHRACDLVGTHEVRKAVRRPGPELRAAANDSLNLSICDWRGKGVGLVKLLVDAAPSSELRFFNQLSEQLQFHNADPDRKPRQIKGVGRDSAYGGAGAWWTRSGSLLVAFKAKKILRLRVNVAGLGDAGSRRAAVILAKRAFARLSEPAS
jgi:hypothetical protein